MTPVKENKGSTRPLISTLKLPRQVEADPRYPAVEKTLAQDPRPLWERGTIQVSFVPFSPALEKTLKSALHRQQVKIGLEQIDKILDSEERGLAALREKQGTPPAYRTSRLLLISDEGTERLYRSCESTLLRHADRVLGLRITVPCAQLVQSLFGEEKQVKVLLVSDRDAVSEILLSLAAKA